MVEAHYKKYNSWKVVKIHVKLEKLSTLIEIKTKTLKHSKIFVKPFTRAHDGTLPR